MDSAPAPFCRTGALEASTVELDLSPPSLGLRRRHESRSQLRAGAIGVASFLEDFPRWLLLAVLAFAPWALGCTPDWTIASLRWFLGVILGSWLLGCLVRRSLPRVHPFLLGIAGALGAQASWMTLNAKFVFDVKLQATPIEPLVSWAPGSVDQALSNPAALHAVLMLGVCCFACDLSRYAQWRRRLWWIMALAGVSVTLLGLAQKVTHARDILWQHERFGETFFATYRYHANAGAYMNLVWPLVAGLLACAWASYSSGGGLSRRRHSDAPNHGSPTGMWRSPKVQLAIASVCLVTLLTGVLANTSRASGVIALGALVGWGVWAAIRAVRGRFETSQVALLMAVGLVFASLLVWVAGFGGFDAIWGRWSEFDKQLTSRNSRLLVAGVCLDMLPHSGFWGFGPDTFRTAFPFFNPHTGPETRGIWYFAHQDYLQTLVEWGWCGATLWAILIFGGLGYAIRNLKRHAHRWRSSDRVFAIAAACGLGTTLIHAMVDFPLQIASIQLYVSCLIGALWCCGQWRAERQTPRSSQPPTSVATCAA